MTEQTPKHFFLFAGASYYPGGGMRDFIDSFETLEAADEYVKENNHDRDSYSYHGRKWDWYHICDIRDYMADNVGDAVRNRSAPSNLFLLK